MNFTANKKNTMNKTEDKKEADNINDGLKNIPPITTEEQRELARKKLSESNYVNLKFNAPILANQ
jgi:hypothetical protein